VVSVDGKKSATVHFVDYGNDASVAQTHLKTIPSQFMNLPKACVAVTLQDVFMEDINVLQHLKP